MANPEDDLKAYDQLCESYRQIDDFRSKLLGFLPVASGTGIWVLLDQIQKAQQATAEAKNLFAAVGLFGFLITAALFCYEIYGIKKCRALIVAGSSAEARLNLLGGQFIARPQNVVLVVNEPFAAGIIYPTVAAAWVFFTCAFAWPAAIPLAPAATVIIGFIGMLAYDYTLRNSRDQPVEALFAIAFQKLDCVRDDRRRCLIRHVLEEAGKRSRNGDADALPRPG